MKQLSYEMGVPTIGVIGTGYIGTGLVELIGHMQGQFQNSTVLTRRPVETVDGINPQRLTNSVDELLSKSDIIVECSGDPVYATPVVRQALESGKDVITMDAELQITTGSFLGRFATGSTVFTEAEGDQPGSLAALNREASMMGFKPLVYGNVKGYLNENPTPEDMVYWSRKNGVRIDQTTSFTDGTKVHIEQVLVANGLKASIGPNGMIGNRQVYDGFDEGAIALAQYADQNSIVLSDYLMSSNNPTAGKRKPTPGVFIVATHPQADYMNYYKLGPGPYYMIERPFHLCHAEILKTVVGVLEGRGALLTNGTEPRFSVAAIAKHDLSPGDLITKGSGSFEVRGNAVEIEQYKSHVPIGLLSTATIQRKVKQGDILEFDDVALPDTEALCAWFSIVNNSKNQTVKSA